jgi:pyruvate formate lyase activating enzyme
LLEAPFPEELLPLGEVERFLDRRSSLLGGVCISGGEPLIHRELPELIAAVRHRGLKVKLDTNGTFPERLAQIDADYIALDLKAPPEYYHHFLSPRRSTGACRAEWATAAEEQPAAAEEQPAAAEEIATAVRRSIEILQQSEVAYELRTTVVPGLVGEEELQAMLPLLPGARRYVLQAFSPGVTLDPAWSAVPAPPVELLERMRDMVLECGIGCEILDGRAH